jgi:hypothetical protein
MRWGEFYKTINPSNYEMGGESYKTINPSNYEMGRIL